MTCTFVEPFDGEPFEADALDAIKSIVEDSKTNWAHAHFRYEITAECLRHFGALFLMMLFVSLSFYLWFHISKNVIITYASDNRRKRKGCIVPAHIAERKLLLLLLFLLLFANRKHGWIFTVILLGYSTLACIFILIVSIRLHNVSYMCITHTHTQAYTQIHTHTQMQTHDENDVANKKPNSFQNTCALSNCHFTSIECSVVTTCMYFVVLLRFYLNFSGHNSVAIRIRVYTCTSAGLKLMIWFATRLYEWICNRADMLR